MDVVGEYLRPRTDSTLFASFRPQWSPFFPALRSLQRTTFVRQAATLWVLKERLWQALLAPTPHDPSWAVVASFPLPLAPGHDVAALLRQQHDQERKVAIREASREAEFRGAADGTYKTPVIDPPWPIDDVPYPTLSVGQIAALGDTDFVPLMDASCFVFLWTTQRFLPVAFDLLRDWGLAYLCTMVGLPRSW